MSKCIYKLKIVGGVRKLEVKSIPLTQQEGFEKLERDIRINNIMLGRLV